GAGRAGAGRAGCVRATARRRGEERLVDGEHGPGGAVIAVEAVRGHEPAVAAGEARREREHEVDRVERDHLRLARGVRGRHDRQPAEGEQRLRTDEPLTVVEPLDRRARADQGVGVTPLGRRNARRAVHDAAGADGDRPGETFGRMAVTAAPSTGKPAARSASSALARAASSVGKPGGRVVGGGGGHGTPGAHATATPDEIDVLGSPVDHVSGPTWYAASAPSSAGSLGAARYSTGMTGYSAAFATAPPVTIGRRSGPARCGEESVRSTATVKTAASGTTTDAMNVTRARTVMGRSRYGRGSRRRGRCRALRGACGWLGRRRDQQLTETGAQLGPRTGRGEKADRDAGAEHEQAPVAEQPPGPVPELRRRPGRLDHEAERQQHEAHQQHAPRLGARSRLRRTLGTDGDISCRCPCPESRAALLGTVDDTWMSPNVQCG